MRDTKRELEKLAIGRHIGQRGHVMEKSRNTRSNDVTQQQNLIGMGDGMLHNQIVSSLQGILSSINYSSISTYALNGNPTTLL